MTGTAGMDAEERELFEKSLQQAAGRHTGAELDAALAEVGWQDALAVDPQVAVAGLFEAQGRAAATSSALDAVLSHALGGPPGAAVVLPGLGRTGPAGSVAGERLDVAGVATGGLGARDRALVVAPAGDGGVRAAGVDVADLTLRTAAGIDPALGLVEVTGEDVPVRSAADVAADAWPTAVAAGQRAVSHELIGASRTMLELAREHALERIQFGRPIAQFQAVRHRLAETLVAIEAADAALAAAWDDGSPLAAGVAKALGGRSARTAARHCQQVLAGIGFTTEHDLHRFVRRVVVLDAVLGDSRTLTRGLGRDLLARRSLPSILPL
jgi:hypothetical protein